MNLENLPHTTLVQRIIPKNAFDVYTTSKQRKLFTDQVSKITWTHKLAPETINLEAKEIKEIQIFRIELKVQEDVKPLLDVMDRAIPYHIIFTILHGSLMYISASSKHPHPINSDNAVIDYTFKTDWFPVHESNYALRLSKSLDAVFMDFCQQLVNQQRVSQKSLADLVAYNTQVDRLNKEIATIKQKIATSKQFNQKVEYNHILNNLVKELKLLHNG